MTATDSTADVLDGLYAQARAAIGDARQRYEAHRNAAAETEPGSRGVHQAHCDLAMRDWDRALGEAGAIERVADALGVDLATDRRSPACVCPEGDRLAVCRIHGLDYDRRRADPL